MLQCENKMVKQCDNRLTICYGYINETIIYRKFLFTNGKIQKV